MLWQSSAVPPSATTETNVLRSSDGKDIFVETDCSATGNCSAGGNETHLMIYNEAQCGAGNPWFDVVTGSCRSRRARLMAPHLRLADAARRVDAGGCARKPFRSTPSTT